MPFAVSDDHQAISVGNSSSARRYIGGRSRIDCGRLPGRLGGDKAADIDQIIRDDPKADPTFHAVVAAIAATLEAMSTLADADAPLASRFSINRKGSDYGLPTCFSPRVFDSLQAKVNYHNRELLKSLSCL
jgi:hypothetical protein